MKSFWPGNVVRVIDEKHALYGKEGICGLSVGNSYEVGFSCTDPQLPSIVRTIGADQLEYIPHGERKYPKYNIGELK